MHYTMRIISRKTLRDFYSKAGHQDAEQPLEAWFFEAVHAEWRSPAEIKQYYRNASIVGDNRVVFNIAGNKYRLVVKVHYNMSICYIRWIGTHRDYDRINVEEV